MCATTPGCGCWAFAPHVPRFNRPVCYLKESTGWTRDGRHAHYAGCLTGSGSSADVPWYPGDADADTCVCPGFAPVVPPHKRDAGSKPMSVGAAVLVGAGLCAALYLGCGMALGRVRGRSGRDLVPHREFWAALPGLARDGCGYVATAAIRPSFRKIRAAASAQRYSGYRVDPCWS